jgi:hypothetical protein
MNDEEGLVHAPFIVERSDEMIFFPGLIGEQSPVNSRRRPDAA